MSAPFKNNCYKLQKVFGWSPSLEFDEGLEKTVEVCLGNNEWLERVTSGDYQRYYEEQYGER
jgi:dTDP-glucose 4,6-dehydratase